MTVADLIDADALARAIVKQLPRVPLDKLLWDKVECAAYLKQSVRTFERTQCYVGFPKPRFVPGKVWVAGEIIDWAHWRKSA
jgi:hypothetical protein